MTKIKYVIAKPNNTSIIIYYSLRGKEMRFPTGVRISNSKYKSGKYQNNTDVQPSLLFKDFQEN